ncbi:putative aspartic peptidase A1 family [Lupinus albus]|uniref:Putative aspartic peptidase A1 family n=1 Tax=Lupinus albus TaxID=3870 RepID=A0A6A4P7H7_LUPAL|nr:putative aspartic peptidase A1 family [Lupinus albus]
MEYLGPGNTRCHCLKGDISGGGILVLSEAMEPDIVYSPLIPKQSRYNLSLESINVNGKMLQIDPEIFKISTKITRTIPQYVGTTNNNGFRCYLVTTRLS